MKVTAELVRELAELAELALDDAEVERMRSDLAAILEYVERVSELDTAAVRPTAHVLDLATPMRDDVPGEPLPVGEVVRNSPEHDERSLVVPKVLE